jgi:hypothetical protein
VSTTERHLRWALLFAGSSREILAALYALDHELARITHAGIDHGVAHTKLNWWRLEVDRLSLGEAAHPVTRRLYAALGTRVDYSRLHERIIAAELLLIGQAPQLLTTPPRFNAFFYRLHGALLQILADALLPPTLATLEKYATRERAADVTNIGAALGKAIGWCDYLSTIASSPAATDTTLQPTRADACTEALEHLSTAETSLQAWPVGTTTSLAVLAALTRARVQHMSHGIGTPLGIFSELLTAWRAARRAARSE